MGFGFPEKISPCLKVSTNTESTRVFLLRKVAPDPHPVRAVQIAVKTRKVTHVVGWTNPFRQREFQDPSIRSHASGQEGILLGSLEHPRRPFAKTNVLNETTGLTRNRHLQSRTPMITNGFRNFLLHSVNDLFVCKQWEPNSCMWGFSTIVSKWCEKRISQPSRVGRALPKVMHPH